MHLDSMKFKKIVDSLKKGLTSTENRKTYSAAGGENCILLNTPSCIAQSRL